MRPNTLGIVIGPGDDLVDLVVDGRSLDDRGDRAKATARELLSSGALHPTVPPRRIAFYGCDCSVWGCSQISAVVERDGWLVRWRDFASVGLAAVLPPEDDPDPAVGEEFVEWLDLPDLVFDADEYVAVVESAAAAAG